MVLHRRSIRRENGSDDVANALARGNLASAPLSEQDRAMLEYAEKLTLDPGEMVQDDVQRLRDAGFDDEAIGMIAIVTARYAFLNRVTDGLGCQLPRGMDKEAERLGVSGNIHR